jgi:hypothetical protein
MAYSPDGKLLVVGDTLGKLVVYDTSSHEVTDSKL